jgi:hypothetical protein
MAGRCLFLPSLRYLGMIAVHQHAKSGASNDGVDTMAKAVTLSASLPHVVQPCSKSAAGDATNRGWWITGLILSNFFGGARVR